ncbi:RraA family protein [Rhizohabitans arisaemae]|uniref:RraA family protein n=1 Tax=Rhizohabitans arisaemae TaxID=2720610 RepID=UPI0024B0F2D1|nr:RraA family protein [Rhizohabitans arisaemae]
MTPRLLALDTCLVSDALDALGLPGATTGIQPLHPATRTIAGTAVTIKIGPKTTSNPEHHLATPAIVASGPGHILVIDNQGRTDVSSWGGILSAAARRKGIEGVVVDGAARDVGEAHDLGFSVYGRTAVPVTARGRIVQEAWDVPIAFAGVTVAPGDLVLADVNGVVFIPSDRAEEVLDIAERLAARERRMIRQIDEGMSVVDVMHDTSFEEATR